METNYYQTKREINEQRPFQIYSNKHETPLVDDECCIFLTLFVKKKVEKIFYLGKFSIFHSIFKSIQLFPKFYLNFFNVLKLKMTSWSKIAYGVKG